MPQCVLSATVSRVRTIDRAHRRRARCRVRRGDPEAFAEIVRRHGPMVLGRLPAGHRPRPRTPRTPSRPRSWCSPGGPGRSAGRSGSASWLHGVAVNTAREARRRTARRSPGAAAAPELGRCDPEPDFDTPRRRSPRNSPACPTGTANSWCGATWRASRRRQSRGGSGCRSGRCTAASRRPARSSPAGCAARHRGGRGLLAVSRSAAFAFSDCPSSRVTELTEAVMRTGTRWKWAMAACAARRG